MLIEGVPLNGPSSPSVTLEIAAHQTVSVVGDHNTGVGQLGRLALGLVRPTGGTVSVMFDLDREGVNGSQQAVLEIPKRCRTRFAWTAALADGQFKGRQPESVTPQEWETAIHPALMLVS